MMAVELARAEVGSHSIAYRAAGDGPALVFLHGFLCDSRVWRRQLLDLADQFRVIAWDAPGAGLSSDPPDPFTVTDWARVLAQFLEVLQVDRAYLCGLSWGGMLAQEFYRLYPSVPIGLILADTYAGWKGSFNESVAAQRLERCVRESSLPANEFVKIWVPKEFFTEAASQELEDEMAAVVRDFHPVGFPLMAKSLADTDTSPWLAEIEVPTLLLWGEDDLRSPLSVAEQFHQAIPGAELVVVPKAAHISNMEQPDEFNAQVRRFVTSHES